MDGAVAQAVGNFSKVQLVAANQVLGGIDLHVRKKIDDPAAVGLMENFLKLGPPGQIIPAYGFNGKVFPDVLFQIADDPVMGISVFGTSCGASGGDLLRI